MTDWPAIRRARRERLLRLVDGPILLLGNGDRSRNLPLNPVPFRQDSTFWYFVGCTEPGAAALLHEGSFTLFLPPVHEDDELWHGPRPSPTELGASLGADEVSSTRVLPHALPQSGVRVLAVADESTNARAAGWTGVPLQFATHHGDEALMNAVIELRRTKGPEEIEELRLAAAATRRAFEITMRATRPGSHEHGLTTVFEAALRMHQCTPGYDTILTQAGEILHNHRHDAPLESGRMVLLDGGGERLQTGYTVDITRTWPVSGTFSPRQRAAYEAVLEAQRIAIEACTPGTRFRAVHDASCRVLAQFLIDEGIVRGSVDGALEQHAHAVFFPHGVGHHLGLDVHDLENFGDRPSYAPGESRPQPFGTRNLRLDLPLEAGWVVTIEPGFYVVPAILQAPALRERFADAIDWDAATRWANFGGIRIEDDVWITADGPQVLTDVPRDADEVQALIGTGPTAEELLCPS